LLLLLAVVAADISLLTFDGRPSSECARADLCDFPLGCVLPLLLLLVVAAPLQTSFNAWLVAA